DIDLPPNSLAARICTYECTFCADCVENNCKMSARIAEAVLHPARSVRRANGEQACRLPSDRLQRSEYTFPTAWMTSPGTRLESGTSHPKDGRLLSRGRAAFAAKRDLA